jgi:TonB family protein
MDNSMILRLLVCLAISILLHIFIVIQPFQLFTKQANPLSHMVTVPVGLVDIPSQPANLNSTNTPTKMSVPPKGNNNGEGVSFEAEGGVGKAYLEKLKVKIFNIWQYPEYAIKKGEQGKVTLSFVLNDKGELVDMGVLVSSGSGSLDSAAMAAVKMASPFGSFTGDIKEKTLKVTGNFGYVLD